MMTGDWYDTDGRRQYAEFHLSELRSAAERERLARQIRQPGRLRRFVGGLLIAAGQALAGHRPEPRVSSRRSPLSPEGLTADMAGLMPLARRLE